MCCCIIFGNLSVGSMAATKKHSVTKIINSGFNRGWSKTETVVFKISGSDFPAMMTYGYSTFGGKKDYIKRVGGMPQGCSCYGQVRNSKKVYKNTNKVKNGQLSTKADVKHTGTVTYKVIMWFE